MGSRPPLQGYNHNIPYKNRIYHVQTEDSGVERPVVSTHMFHEGLILTSERFEYHELLDLDNWLPKVKRKMKDQHKRVMKALIHGDLDRQIVDLLGKLDPDDEDEAMVLDGAVLAEEPAAEAAPAPDEAEAPSGEAPEEPAPEEPAAEDALPEVDEVGAVVISEEPPEELAAPEEPEPLLEEPDLGEFLPPEPEEEEPEAAPDGDEFVPPMAEPEEPQEEELFPTAPEPEEATTEPLGIPDLLTSTIQDSGPADDSMLEEPAELGGGLQRPPMTEIPVEFIRPPTAEERPAAAEEPPEEQWVEAGDEFIPPASVELSAEARSDLAAAEPSDEVLVEDDMEPVQLMSMEQDEGAPPFSMDSLAPPDFDATTLVDAEPSPDKHRVSDRRKFQHSITGELDVESGEQPEAEPTRMRRPSVEVDQSLPSIRYSETAELPLENQDATGETMLRSAETAELPVRGPDGELVPDMDEMIARYRAGENASRDTQAMPIMEDEQPWEVDDTDPVGPDLELDDEESGDDGGVFEFVFGDDEGSAEYRAVPAPRKKSPRPIKPRPTGPFMPESARPSQPLNPLRPTAGMHRRVAPARPQRPRADAPPVARASEPAKARTRPRTMPPAMVTRPPAATPLPEPKKRTQKYKTRPSGVFPLVGGTARRFTPTGTEAARSHKDTGPLRRRPSSLLRYTAPTRSHGKVDASSQDPRITQGRQQAVTGPRAPTRARGVKVTTRALEAGSKPAPRSASTSVVVSRPIIVGKAPPKPKSQTQGSYSYVKESEEGAPVEIEGAVDGKQDGEDRGLDEVILAYLEENE